MSISNNVTVTTADTGARIATGTTASITEDGENASVWGGAWSSKPTSDQAYRLSSGGLLDWTGIFNGHGAGTQQSPYAFTVTDSETESGGLLAASAVRLSPPWYTVWNKIAQSIGADPRNAVLPLKEIGQGQYLVQIVSSLPSPAALATILVPSYKLGNVTVEVQVLSRTGHLVKPEPPSSSEPADAVLSAIQQALGGNPLFSEAFKTQKGPYSPPTIGSVVAIFQKAVIQFFNDDLTDYYGNFNGVAASVFATVLNTKYSGGVTLSFGTVPSRQ